MSTADVRAKARAYLRDFVTDGVAPSGKNEPSKAQGIEAFDQIAAELDRIEGFAAAGVNWTPNVIRVRSTGNVAIASALENGDTLNGVTLATGDHVFLGSQTAPAENGIYTVVASGAASRATFADSAAELAGIAFTIRSGTTGAGEGWTLNLDAAAITVGTTALNFSPLPAAPDFAARTTALEMTTGNVNPDPFLQRLPYRGSVGPFAAVGFGTAVGKDAASPFGGGSITSVSDLIRPNVPLSDLPFRVGDVISVRPYLVCAAGGGSVTLEFYDSTGTIIGGGPAAFYASAAGVNTAKLSATIPTGTVAIRLGSSGVAAVLYGLSMGYGTATPGFQRAGQPAAPEVPSAIPQDGIVVLMGDSIIANTVDVVPEPDVYIDTEVQRLLQRRTVRAAVGGTTWAVRADAATSASAQAFSDLSITKLVDAIVSGTWTAQDAAVTTLGGANNSSAAVAALKAVDWTKVRVVLIAAGTNDYGAIRHPIDPNNPDLANGNPIGVVGDTDTTKVHGAVRNAIRKLRQAYPHLQIIISTPTYRDRLGITAYGTASISGTTMTVALTADPGFAVGLDLYCSGLAGRTKITALGTGTGSNGTYTIDRSQTLSSRLIYAASNLPGGTTANYLGLTLKDYVDAIRAAADDLLAPVLDAWREIGVNGDNVYEDSEDGLHPAPLTGLYRRANYWARGIARLAR